MIEARMRKAQRLLKVQKDLQRLEERKVAALQGRQAELAAQQDEIIRSLNADDGLKELFIAAIVRRLKRLGDEASLVAQELERRSATLRMHAGRAKVVERRSRAYEEQHARALAQKELMDVIERFLKPDDASLP